MFTTFFLTATAAITGNSIFHDKNLKMSCTSSTPHGIPNESFFLGFAAVNGSNSPGSEEVVVGATPIIQLP